MKKIVYLIIVALIIASAAFGAIPTTDINSYYPLAQGPSMPFPQFRNYTAGGQQTLFTLSDTDHQPDGVTHAEMEKWISEAWQIYLNGFVQAGNTTVTYQLQNGSPVSIPLWLDSSWQHSPGPPATGVSEGHGYALLMAAIMGDKKNFDSLWFWINENYFLNNTKIYSTGTVYNAGYKNGAQAPAWEKPGDDAATDGDEDMAMGALIAWKQWGDNTGYYAPGGTGALNVNGQPAIQYKQMALDAMRFLVERSNGPDHTNAVNAWSTGDIGFDGYYKSGNTWSELTNFVTASTTGSTCGPINGPVVQGPSSKWYDYGAPAYYRCFANALQANGDPRDNASTLTWCNGTTIGNWNVSQFQKATASSIWLQSQLNLLPFPVAGDVTVAGTTATFGNDNEGEDFRSIWRQSLDYMLNGNPAQSWNPATHTITAAGNQDVYNAAMDVYNFYKQYPTCYQPGSYPITFNIPEMIWNNYTTNGTPQNGDHIPYVLGSSTASVVIAANATNDFLFMERWFRELCTLWDTQNGTDGSQIGTGLQAGYMGQYAKYFHEFFRQLGLVIITGNYVDPGHWNPLPNMKVYKAVDKTYAFHNDFVTYWLNYRNYGSVDAANVIITDTLPTIYNFVSATNGGLFNSGTNSVTWNIGPVPGLKTQNYNTTAGGVTLVVQVKSNAPNGRYCNTADIACSNGTGWRSNEFPNEVSYIMKRSCVDIVPAALTITKTASVTWAKPADTVTYTIDYCDSSSAGWLDGGRSGVIFSIGKNNLSGPPATWFVMRGMHSASEPWIDWGNYRLSYFIYGQGQGFMLQQSRVEGTSGVSVTAENLVPGCTDMVNQTGCWDQRIIIKNNASVSMPSHLLMKFFNNMPNMHYPDGILTYGGTGTLNPLLFVLNLQTSPYVTTHDWTKDYSDLPVTGAYAYKDAGDNAPTGILYPIGPDYTNGDPSVPGVPVPKINRDSCDGANPMISNVLIEEWDGYTWRRVYGTGPQPGREVTNVVITDSLPTSMNWGGFIGTSPGTRSWNAGNRTIQWNVGNMLVNQCAEVSYWAIAGGSCPSAVTLSAVNNAFVSADHESPIADSKTVSISCSAPPPQLAPSSLTKTSDKANYNTGENVTYTLNYTNFNGTVSDSSVDGTILSSAANWTKESGSNDTFAAGGITVPNSNASKYHYNYSNGINGEILTSINMTNNSSDFGVYFRNTMAFTIHIAGTGVSSPITIWNGTTAVASGNISFSSLNIDLRIDLSGPNVNVYIKDRSASTWNVLPTLSYTTAPQTSGYAGIINGTPAGGSVSGGHTFISWYTSLDTAFNVLLYDPVPTGINYTSAYNGGTYTAGTIMTVTWPQIAMMTSGQSAVFSWVGAVAGTCTDIYNTGYAAPKGLTYTVGDRMSIHVNCGNTTPTITPSITPTSTMTRTPTCTFTMTSTQTSTLTSTTTDTMTSTPTLTSTNTATSTASVTPSQTITQTSTQILISATITQTLTVTNTQTLTQSPTQTQTVTQSITPSSTQTSTPTVTCTSSVTPVFTATVTQTDSPTLTITATNTQTLTPTFTMTITPSPTISPVYSLTDTLTATPTGTPSATSTWTPTSTGTGTITNTSTPTASPTASGTFTGTPTVTYTNTASPTPSVTKTPTGTRTITPTMTGTFTRTASPTITPSATVTLTPAPSPVNMQITLNASGDNPKPGSKITYDITIRNPENRDATNINIWDTLPDGCMITGVTSPSPYIYQMNGNVISWDFNSLDLGPAGGADEITVEYTVEITDINAARNSSDGLIHNTASVNYNDPAYPAPGVKHPPIKSDLSLYPTGRPVVFPNPFNPKTAKGGTLKFANMVPGSVIQIFTISGEAVAAITAQGTNVEWDGKNGGGSSMAAGIYYFVITNKTTNSTLKGKLFVVNN